MTFKIDGFLSAGMKKFSARLRTVPEYKAWFEFAEGLYRLGLEGLEGTEPPRTDNQKLAVTALYQDSMIGTDHRLVAEARMRARAVARNRAR